MKHMKNLLILLSLAGWGLLSAQQYLPNGQWRAWVSHNTPLQSVEKDGVIYTITEGGLTSYDDRSGEQRSFSTIEGLAGIDPMSIHYNAARGIVFIGYADGSINYFSDPSEIRLLSDIRRSTFYTQKRIYHFASDGSRLYVATDFGLVIYSLDTFLPLFTATQFVFNPSRQPVLSVALQEDRIWVTMGVRGLYSAPVNAGNLSDPMSWRREDGQGALPQSEVLDVIARYDELFIRLRNTVYKRLANGDWVIEPALDQAWTHLSIHDNHITASLGAFTRVFRADFSITGVFTTGNVVHALYYNDAVYQCERNSGLLRTQNEQTLNLSPPGPPNNFCTRLVAGNGELYIAPKGYDASYNPSADGSGIYYYSAQQGWKILTRDNGLPADFANDKFARAHYDPASRKAWLGSWGRGLVELKEGVVQAAYSCHNSALSVVGGACDLNNPENTRVSGIARDINGNLWVSQSFAQRPLAVQKPDGQWISYPSSLFGGANMVDMIADDYGSKWIMDRRAGIVLFNDRGTLDNTADDVVIRIGGSAGRGGLPTEVVNTMAKDLDGFIWVGTANGVVVFYDPFSLSQGRQSASQDGQCPVFNRRCLLKDEPVNAIAVDGGNRKWIATENGVYLISPEGSETLLHFTTQNSPIFSNAVLDVSIDAYTGEVFFATSKGVISYQGDATDGSKGCDDLLVYPNPVTPDYEGMITIRGSATASTVRISTASGLLVRELNAQGGTAVWDGRDVYGRRVAPGVYLALSATAQGQEACVGKFSIVR